MNKKAFSMVELIFVIVILGILGGIAIPKLVGSREDAYIAKGKNQIASIKNGINLKASSNLLSGGGCGGSGRYPVDLNETQITPSNYNSVGTPLFDGVLQEPILSSNSDGGWMATGTYISSSKDFPTDGTYSETYVYRISSTRSVTFTYYNTALGGRKAGTFYCDPNDATTGNDCKILTK